MNIQKTDCRIELSVDDWGNVLSLLKRHSGNNRAIIKIEESLRRRVNQIIDREQEVLNRERDKLLNHYLGEYLEGEAETEELEIPRELIDFEIGLPSEEPTTPLPLPPLDEQVDEGEFVLGDDSTHS